MVAGVVNAHFQRSYAPGIAKSRDPFVAHGPEHVRRFANEVAACFAA
jgi:hypothetical protein